jgi:hypothetical protein
MSRRVFLHIGSPKTGTTFLQQVLWAERDRAADQGLLLPGRSVRDHYFASLDLRGAAQAEPGRAGAAGAWARLAEEAAAWPGDVLLSHELFALAGDVHAERAVSTYRDLGFEVHLVITARDLARQLPAHWQEAVKARWGLTYDEYVHAELGGGDGRYLARVQDYAGLVRRWGAAVPPGSVHVVTVPPRAAPRDLLWRRFAGLLGLSADEFALDVRANESLGLEQTELLRRVNLALGDRLPRPGPYPGVVKGTYAHQVLAARPGSRLTLGGADLELARDRSRDQVDELLALGVDVVGDLDELLVADVGPDQGTMRQQVPVPSLLDEAVEGVIGLLEELGETQTRHRAEVATLRSRIGELQTSYAEGADVAAAPAPQPGSARARRAFLHIGSPKTGTTFLQQVLWHHRARLRQQGVLLPLSSLEDHHHASLDLRGVPGRVGDGADARGAWTRLVDACRAWDGDVVVSHETLAAADDAQADTAVRAFADLGFEVHVVITARDLARQTVAHWQQAVKGRSTMRMADYVAEALDPETGHGRYIALVQDAASLARRWGARLPSTSVHLITVPPSGAPRDLLWRRFAGVLGLPAADQLGEAALDVGANESLGLEQAELLRRVNLALGDRLPRPGPYPRVVRGILVREVLAHRPGTRLALTSTETGVLRERSADQVEQLRGLGLDVVGDLDDLLVREGAERDDGSVEVADGRLLEEAVEATIGLLEVIARERTRHRKRTSRLRGQLHSLETSYDEGHAPASVLSRLAGRVKVLVGRSGGRDE